MPKLVVEIPQSNAFSMSSDGGSEAYSATRAWRVILTSPNEAINVNTVTGVNIGDAYSTANPIPCVSIEGRADGDSKLVKIITAQYRATAGGGAATGGDGTQDPKRIAPALRPAMYSMSTSLTEVVAWGGSVVSDGVSAAWSPVTNPAGDLVDPPTRLEPVVTINIDQYSTSDQSLMLGYCGFVNSDIFQFSGLSIGTHCCMLQGISSRPIVEQFGQATFRGFMVTFSFAVRAHWAYTRQGFQAIGWDQAVPMTGMNIVQSGLGNAQVDQKALALQHDEATGRVKVPYEYATGILIGDKTRAMVPIPYPGGGFTQTPSAQPVPLNMDGTPRSRSAVPPVLINRICVQPEMAFGANFSNFGIRGIG